MKYTAVPPLPEPDEIYCPICNGRFKHGEYEIVYTKTIDGRIMKTLICPTCKVQRGFIVEKEGE